MCYDFNDFMKNYLKHFYHMQTNRIISKIILYSSNKAMKAKRLIFVKTQFL